MSVLFFFFSSDQPPAKPLIYLIFILLCTLLPGLLLNISVRPATRAVRGETQSRCFHPNAFSLAGVGGKVKPTWARVLPPLRAYNHLLATGKA